MQNGVLFFYFTAQVTESFGFKFFFFLNCCPTKTSLITASKTYCLYNQDITSTKWQIMVIIEKREEDF